jgi:hypothetical protein
MFDIYSYREVERDLEAADLELEAQQAAAEAEAEWRAEQAQLAAEWEADARMAHWDDDPSPYDGMGGDW